MVHSVLPTPKPLSNFSSAVGSFCVEGSNASEDQPSASELINFFFVFYGFVFHSYLFSITSAISVYCPGWFSSALMVLTGTWGLIVLAYDFTVVTVHTLFISVLSLGMQEIPPK